MSELVIKVTTKKRVRVKFLQARCGVRYWEDATVNGIADADGKLIPFRDGDNWVPLIELATGKIVNWPNGTTADIHYKVCDDGSYQLLGDGGHVVLERDGYVIDMMCPEGAGYGDYVIMKVGEDGAIAVLWRKRHKRRKEP